jgi:glycerol-3-phosphate O-acyltransferase
MVERLNIVPVSIAYELDPCDSAKANELAAKAEGGTYMKSEFEDIQSSVKGIVGDKGRVHVGFGEPIRGEFESADELAAEIDRQIHQNYRLHATNLAAAGESTEEGLALLESRLSQVDGVAKDILKAMYAKPVLNYNNAQTENH